MCAFFNTTAVFSEAKTAKIVSDQIRRDLQYFPEEAVVVWGSAFPYEAAYPVLKQTESAMAFKLYGLGVFTLAPFSVSHTENVKGRGMVDRLVSENGIPILGANHLWGFLNTYCKERLSGVSHELTSHQYGQLHISWRQCESKAAQQ
ncbi:hypothetical protein [Stutzerimonas nitrititolerans]|uniref:hypothetical protein n=1 Tax=Stutzerimonas nitrititolerans TaxID=2482751 RepID=UPI00289D8A62|nr:hypothetical protein [Stutzerimonas nitrititolerans]